MRRCLFLVAIVVCVPSCYRPPLKEGELRERINNPYYVLVGDHDSEWDREAVESQAHLAQFIRVMQEPKANQTGFAVKAILQEGNHSEAIWLTSLHFDGKTFHGKVNNDPIHLRKINVGDRMSVDQSRIRDWMYIENGQLRGGYTIKLLHRQLDIVQKKKLEDSLGFAMH